MTKQKNNAALFPSSSRTAPTILALWILLLLQSACCIPPDSYGSAISTGGRRSQEDRFLIEPNLLAAALDRDGAYASLDEAPIRIADDAAGYPLSLFAVFDGHGGFGCSEYAKNKIVSKIVSHQPIGELAEMTKGLSVHSDASATISARWVKELISALSTTAQVLDKEIDDRRIAGGTTAVIAVIVGKHLLLANIGDSRAVMCCDGDLHSGRAVQLTEDHKPSDPVEKKRIEDAGGFVLFYGVWRVQGVLAVSRALGDSPLNKYVIPDPDFTTYDIGDDTRFIILASDGLWDVMTSQEAVDFVTQRLETHPPSTIAEELVKEANTRRTPDNVTVAIVDLHRAMSKAESGDKDTSPVHDEL